MCRTGGGSNGGTSESQCPAGDDCCNNSMSGAQTCSATCASPTHPLDCTGNTGADECGAGTLCCAEIVLVGGMVGSCSTSELTSSCQATCADNLPGASCGSTANPLTFTLRLCSATADCANDGNRTNCCAYNDSSIYWCVESTILTTSCKR